MPLLITVCRIVLQAEVHNYPPGFKILILSLRYFHPKSCVLSYCNTAEHIYHQPDWLRRPLCPSSSLVSSTANGT